MTRPADHDPGTGRRWQRRLARPLLIVGLASALLYFLPALPREQTLIFRDTHESLPPIRTLRGTWREEGAVLSGFTLNLSEHGTPRRVRHEIQLPNGVYQLELVIERRRAPTRTHAAKLPLNHGLQAEDSRLGDAAAQRANPHTDSRGASRETTQLHRVSLEGGETIISL